MARKVLTNCDIRRKLTTIKESCCESDYERLKLALYCKYMTCFIFLYTNDTVAPPAGSLLDMYNILYMRDSNRERGPSSTICYQCTTTSPVSKRYSRNSRTSLVIDHVDTVWIKSLTMLRVGVVDVYYADTL